MTGFDEKSGDIPHYHDHRERVRQRFDEIGSEGFRDYELLELILFQAIPRVDTKPIAKALLQRFGSFAEVLAAPPARLMEVKGVGERAAHHLKVTYAACQRFLQSAASFQPARPGHCFLTLAQLFQQGTKLIVAHHQPYLSLRRRNAFSPPSKSSPICSLQSSTAPSATR